MVLAKEATLVSYYNAVVCFGKSIRNKSGGQMSDSAGLLPTAISQEISYPTEL
jgi:hypothetical protein